MNDSRHRDGEELEQLVDLVEQLVKRARGRMSFTALADVEHVLELLAVYSRAHGQALCCVQDAGKTFGPRRLKLEGKAAEHGCKAGVVLRRARAVCKTLKVSGRRAS